MRARARRYGRECGSRLAIPVSSTRGIPSARPGRPTPSAGGLPASGTWERLTRRCGYASTREYRSSQKPQRRSIPTRTETWRSACPRRATYRFWTRCTTVGSSSEPMSPVPSSRRYGIRFRTGHPPRPFRTTPARWWRGCVWARPSRAVVSRRLRHCSSRLCSAGTRGLTASHRRFFTGTASLEMATSSLVSWRSPTSGTRGPVGGFTVWRCGCRRDASPTCVSGLATQRWRSSA